jgi:hypothetical protein
MPRGYTSGRASFVVLQLVRDRTRGAHVACQRCVLDRNRPAAIEARKGRADARARTNRAARAVGELPHLGQLSLERVK